MSDTKKSTKQAVPPTVITLTLPEGDGIEHSGTLLIARGELAHVRQFTYLGVSDITAAIKEAYIALAAVEAEPPVIPDLPKETPKPAPKGKAAKPVAESEQTEPTIEVPLKKGSIEVKISHLKIVGGDTDAAAYRQAVLIAGKLIDGKLWDGQSPIRFDDVYAVQRKLKHLSDKELSLFTLDDFVQVGAAVEPSQDAANEGEAEPLTLVSSPAPSANGHHPDDESVQSSLI